MDENGSTRIPNRLFQETERTGEDDDADDGAVYQDTTASESAWHHGIVPGLDMICSLVGTHVTQKVFPPFLCQDIRENISILVGRA